MAFNPIAAIDGYIDQNSYDLLSKSILETNLAEYFNVRVGLSARDVQITVMDSELVIQDGANCGWDASGDTSFSVIDMKLANNKSQQEYCPQVLRETFLAEQMTAGAEQDSISFESSLADLMVRKLKQSNEDFLINGSGSINGLKGLITDTNGAVKITATGWTSTVGAATNAITRANAMYEAMTGTTQLRDDLILIVSPATYRTIKVALVNQNLYHFAPGERVLIPGIDVEVVPAYGLRGADVNKKYLVSRQDLYMGTDLLNDFETFSVFYDRGADVIKSNVRWRLGVAVNNIDGCVYEG